METIKHHEIPGHVTLFTGTGGLPALRIETTSSTAEIYLHGAHVTRFQKTGEAPLLFLSDASEYEHGKPIRGGVPLIFPWFGPRDDLPAHGFARLADWDLVSTQLQPDGSVTLHLQLPPDDQFQVDFAVTVGASLTMALTVTNTGASDFSFENCQHTYFQIGDIHQITLTGLHGVRCIDKILGTDAPEAAETIRITGETDRIYQNSAHTVDIHDPVLGRIIHVRKSGSLSTVVWNPWIEKSILMRDFGDNEYLHMVCVESGNIGDHTLTLAPTDRTTLTVEIDSTCFR